MHLLLVAMNRASKFIILTPTSSVNDYDNNNNDNNTTSRRTGNTTNMTAGGLSASSALQGANSK